MLIMPPEPTPVKTAFAAVSPAMKFKLDAVGFVVPVGQIVKKPQSCVGLTAVTLRATDPIEPAGRFSAP